MSVRTCSLARKHPCLLSTALVLGSTVSAFLVLPEAQEMSRLRTTSRATFAKCTMLAKASGSGMLHVSRRDAAVAGLATVLLLPVTVEFTALVFLCSLHGLCSCTRALHRFLTYSPLAKCAAPAAGGQTGSFDGFPPPNTYSLPAHACHMHLHTIKLRTSGPGFRHSCLDRADNN